MHLIFVLTDLKIKQIIKIEKMIILYLWKQIINQHKHKKFVVNCYFNSINSNKSFYPINLIYFQDILTIKLTKINILAIWSHLKDGKENVGGCEPPRRNTCCCNKWRTT